MKNKLKKLVVICTVVCAMFAITACSQKVEEQVAEHTEEVTEVVEENAESSEDVTEVEEVVKEEAEEELTEAPEEGTPVDLENGVYLANFDTDSTMFHVNETFDGKGVLTVEDGKATIHIVLVSKNILNLFEGTVDNLDESKFLEPTVEEVTYPDGLTEEVNAFDVNVPYLDKEFDLALIGKKGVWYDHKVSVSNPEPYIVECGDEPLVDESEKASEDKNDTVAVTLTGGSGKSTVESPAKVSTNAEGQKIVTIIWSSPHYDYMIVDGEKLLPINTEGNSTFEIPIGDIPCSIDVIADTVAMSKPHEIEYNLSFE